MHFELYISIFIILEVKREHSLLFCIKLLYKNFFLKKTLFASVEIYYYIKNFIFAFKLNINLFLIKQNKKFNLPRFLKFGSWDFEMQMFDFFVLSLWNLGEYL